MKTDYTKADVPRKDIAMLDYVAKVTSDPCNVVKADMLTIRQAGFSDSEILDIVQVAAYFNYVNRLACGLGVELEGYWSGQSDKEKTPFD